MALLWMAAAVSAVALRPLWFVLASHLRPCIFRSLTGLPCPSCGTTRAAVALLHGDLPAAIAANPLASMAGIVFIAGAPLAVTWAAVCAPAIELPKPLPLRIRIGIIAVIVLNWLYLISGS